MPHNNSHSCRGGAGNGFPIPGLELAIDSAAITVMALSLSAVFGGGLTEAFAKSLAFTAIKSQIQKQPVKYIGKEFSKLIPFAGSVFCAGLSAALIEAAGWEIANHLDRKQFLTEI